MNTPMNVVLISTYELGHQPFGLASPAAWLRARGAQVVCMDLSRELLREEPICAADLLAFYVPMHTATRLATQLIDVVRQLNPHAHLCFYGLYAPVNEAYLRGRGVDSIFGGEFEASLANLTARLTNQLAQTIDTQTKADTQAKAEAGVTESRDAGLSNAASHAMSAAVSAVVSPAVPPVVSPAASAAVLPADSPGVSPVISPVISLDRLNFIVPDRTGLPPLHEYAHVMLPDGGHLVAGYTEASRGCKHLCRHCPIVPVYNGVFRVVSREVVLADIRQQVRAGAEHITFGDPDFFNGPAHALAIVRELHGEFPHLSYDVTIKIEHLLNHSRHLATLRDTGCLFVTTAVESVDDAVLERLAKGHTRADFLAVVAHFRELGLVLQPTFVPFTPWTTLESYRDLLTVLVEQDLLENIAPIQLGIRLLVPAGSRMLELADMRAHLGEFDGASLYHTWKHRDPRVDALAARVQEVAAAGDKLKRTRTETFVRIWEAAAETASGPANALADLAAASSLSPTIIPPISTVHAQSVAARWRLPAITARPAIPHFTEPWYCCAEPTKEQFISIGATGSRPDARAGAQPAGAPPRRSEKNVSRELSQLGARADAFL
jgi:hypothetical protein